MNRLMAGHLATVSALCALTTVSAGNLSIAEAHAAVLVSSNIPDDDRPQVVDMLGQKIDAIIAGGGAYADSYSKLFGGVQDVIIGGAVQQNEVVQMLDQRGDASITDVIIGAKVGHLPNGADRAGAQLGDQGGGARRHTDA